MWPTVVAVLGTLAGATLSFLFQSRQARRARTDVLADRTRTELLTAAVDLGAALVNYRHSQIARQTHLLREHARHPALADEVRVARGEAWASLFRLELLTSDSELIRPAYNCMTKIRGLKTIQELTELDERGDDARKSIHAFIRAGRDRLTTTVSP
jgi:hypothetical protein